MNYTIYYPTPLDKIENLSNNNIDICVTVNGKHFG